MFYVSLSQKNKKSEKVSSQVDSSILKSLTLHLCRLYMNLTLVKLNLNLNLTLKLDFILYNLYLFARRLLGGSGVSDNNSIFRSKLKYFQLLENL